MLFELGGKRKRLIQVIYVLLAGLMFIALVGFGIGGATSGGIFDALGIGGGSSGSDPQYSQQIDSANEALQQDPKDEKALLKLARYNFLEGQAALETDDQGRQSLSQDSVDSYRAAADAWERYLKTDPKQPDDNVAGLMLKVFATSAGTDPAELESDVNGAYESAKIVADARPSLGSYTELATWAYLSGNTEAGDAAKQKALKKSAPDQSQLQNPLGGLGSDSSGAIPGATP